MPTKLHIVPSEVLNLTSTHLSKANTWLITVNDKDKANERKENLFSVSRVQLILYTKKNNKAK